MAAPLGWLSLALISLAGISVRHVFNIRAKGKSVGAFVIAAVIFMALAMTFPLALKKKTPEILGIVGFSEVIIIVDKHCTSCHSATPTHEAFDEAPSGFLLGTDELIRQNRALILERAGPGGDMPLGNETGMTETEREILRVWGERE